ncbi:hypothetical protein NECHADRAFT_77081 [Paecilomyces variotii No. 5]|uniref:Zn(2)-C6 fungal-type domain-containing protein n=1 Tax=Byssochlamys spectabilis (strain No. 5 / NBRC 109023) TaxID=1356009 RepID=V5F7R8_BYSSN|nr:hypothetical protein NECHADRAFT_77081 [Paecilomyces variotii No. 5]
MITASPQESPEPEGNRKRRRTVLACNECREKKRKCDGIKPVCGACERRGISNCVWDEERINKVWNNRYIESLRNRIKELESQQENHSSRAGAQVENTAFPLATEADPPSYPVVDSAPLPTNNIDSVQAFRNSAVLTPPGNQTQSGESQGENTVHGLENPNYVLPDWSLGLSLPVNSKLAPSTSAGGCETVVSDSEDDGVDAMGVMSHFPAPNSGRKRRPSNYFGPSSTKGLLDKARTAMDRGRNTNISDTSTTPLNQTIEEHCASTAVPTQSNGFRNDGGVFGMVVPSRPEADDLIKSYWHWMHSLYPFIHRPSFEERYLAMWWPQVQPGRSNDSPNHPKEKGIYANINDRLFYCMLNTVFSLGALFSTKVDHKHRATASYAFYERAKRLIDIDLLADGSLALVQTLLLMGQYLQSTEMSNSCWNIIGLAVEIEMRRRAWAGCVMLDRVLSLTYGRPLMVHSMSPQSQLMLPSPIDDQYLTLSPQSAGSQPNDVPSLVHCYIRAVQLQEILGHILTLFYYGNPYVKNSSVGTTDLQRILNVDKELVSWHNKLPEHLRIDTCSNYTDSGPISAEKQAIFRRQSTVLEVRFLHVRLMMLRPVLSIISDTDNQNQSATSFLDEALSTSSNIENDMLLKARAMCVNIAHELLRTIESSMRVTESLLPPSWYTVFYIHSCAVVFLTALLHPPARTESPEEASLIGGFNRCLMALQIYESQSRTARRCIQSLTRIKHEVFSKLNRNIPPEHDADGLSQHMPPEYNDERLDHGLRYSRPDLTDRNEELRSMNALLNDDSFHQYIWMSDVSSLSQNAFVHGQFFGQSSLSRLAVVSETSVVKVNARPDEIPFLAPLGCGYLTGSGTVLNVLRPDMEDSIVVLGLGAVGLAALMAAKALGLRTIVAVDLLDTKLKIAYTLGATDMINTSTQSDLATALRRILPTGADYIVDATGSASLLETIVDCLGHGGTLALVGVPSPEATLKVNALDLLLSCKRIVGVIEGRSDPRVMIPQLLQLFREGKFPIDRLAEFYPAYKLPQAIEDLKSGSVIKPILSWGDA